jgi:hypothetical protein
LATAAWRGNPGFSPKRDRLVIIHIVRSEGLVFEDGSVSSGFTAGIALLGDCSSRPAADRNCRSRSDAFGIIFLPPLGAIVFGYFVASGANAALITIALGDATAAIGSCRLAVTGVWAKSCC